ncbi:MAG: hypothetical protein IJ141_03540 [Lachnospiraceae bacterium]|nr:hypothetical protein [Lachnospiraceae bacterium]
MNRLLRAEWYRMTKTMRFWLMAIILVLFGAVVPFINGPENAGEYLIQTGEDSAILLILFVAMFAAVLTATAFGNRTVYYEVMSGKRPMQILVSKCLVIAGTITGVMGVSFVAATLIFGSAKGYGELDDVAVRLLLYIVVLLHATVMGVLMVTTFRGALGAVICYLRFMFVDTLVSMIFEVWFEDSPSKIMKYTRWLLMTQPMSAFGEKITGEVVCAILMSFVLETLLWGGLSYIFMKKRLYK